MWTIREEILLQTYYSTICVQVYHTYLTPVLHSHLHSYQFLQLEIQFLKMLTPSQDSTPPSFCQNQALSLNNWLLVLVEIYANLELLLPIFKSLLASYQLARLNQHPWELHELHSYSTHTLTLIQFYLRCSRLVHLEQ